MNHFLDWYLLLLPRWLPLVLWRKKKISTNISIFRFLQPEGVHPVPAPAGLHHLGHVADGGGAGGGGGGGAHQPRQPGLQTILAGQVTPRHL